MMKIQNSDDAEKVVQINDWVQQCLEKYESENVTKVHELIDSFIKNENKSLAMSLVAFSLITKDEKYKVVYKNFQAVVGRNLLSIGELVKVKNDFDSCEKMFQEANKMIMDIVLLQNDVIQELCRFVRFDKD
mgnify:CR=1 FL=1